MRQPQLSWSHYCELLVIDDDLELSFYEQQSIREKGTGGEGGDDMEGAISVRHKVIPPEVFDKF
jgi:hypothetical protein